jgi:hypothetical protein
MPNAEEEVIDIFRRLSPENQHTFLMYARVACAAEDSIKKSVSRALGQVEKTPQEDTQLGIPSPPSPG